LELLNCTPIVGHNLTNWRCSFSMSKFTGDEKLAAVQRYLAGTESYASIGVSIGTSDSIVRNWVKQYEHHGVEVLFKKSYTSYSAQFKLDVLNYMNDNGTSPNETAAIFNISSPGMIRKWRILFETEGVDALKPKKKGCSSMKNKNQKVTKKQASAEESIEALQEELERLRMENAYLKKLNALVQNKEKSPNKTKRK
jgi:transposase